MQMILLSCEEKNQKEEGLRVIMLGGSVEYTGQKDVYRVPNDTLRLLDERKIPYQILGARSGG